MEAATIKSMKPCLEAWLQAHTDVTSVVQTILNCKNRLTHNLDPVNHRKAITELEVGVVTLYEISNLLDKLTVDVENFVKLESMSDDVSESVMALLRGVSMQCKLDQRISQAVLDSVRDEVWNQDDFVTMVASVKFSPYVSLEDVKCLMET
jgi:hypothetical protein